MLDALCGLGKVGRVSGCGYGLSIVVLFTDFKTAATRDQIAKPGSVYLPPYYATATTQPAVSGPVGSYGMAWLDYQPFVNSFFVLSCFGTSMDYLRCS